MKIQENKGAAMLTVIMVILVLSILSAAMLSLISNQTRIVEHDISRVKSKYANEASMVRQLELLRRQLPMDGTHQVSGKYDDFNQDWEVGISSQVIGDLLEIEAETDYKPTF